MVAQKRERSAREEEGGIKVKDSQITPRGVAIRLLLTFALVIGLMPSLQTTQAFADSSGSEQTETTSPSTGTDTSGTDQGGKDTGSTDTGSTDSGSTGTDGTEGGTGSGSGTETGGTEGSGSTDQGTTETKEKVAKIGETEYESLKDAFDKANTGDTVTLIKDNTDVYGAVVKGKTITLDMAGKKITSDYKTNFDSSKQGTSPDNRIIAVQEGGNLTIKGNGTIEGPADDAEICNTMDEKALILVEGGDGKEGTGATLTIEDGTITSGISSDKKCGFYGILPRYNGTVILGKSDGTGPTITTGRSVIGENNTMPKANVTIYGGTYECKKTECKGSGQDTLNHEETVIAATASGTIDIKGGEFKGKNILVSRYKTTNQTITISGGKFTSTNKDIVKYDESGKDESAAAKTATVAAATTEAAAGERTIKVSGGTFSSKLDAGMLAENFTLTENADGTFAATDEVASIGDTKYATLQAAIDAATDGQTVTLLKDLVDIYGVVVKNKTITLDMAGKKITSDYGNGFNKDNSSKSPECRIIAVQQGGNLTIKGNGTIEGPADDAEICNTMDEKALILVEGGDGKEGTGATLTIEDGTITSGISSDKKCGFYGILPRYNGTVILGKSDGTGPTMKTGRSCVGENNTMKTANITIYGGTYECKKTDDKGTGQDQNKKEQTVIAATASGTINIHGGTFKGTHCLVTRYQNTSQTINITGGNFEGTDKCIVKGTDNGSGDTETTTGNTVCVTGGTFKNEVDENLCGNGYKCEANSDGTYGIKASDPVAEVTNGGTTTSYASLQDAFKAALSGSTIKMLKDAIEVYGIKVEGKTLTLDMAGKSIKSENPENTASTGTESTETKKTYKYEATTWPEIFEVTGNNTNFTITGNGTITGPTGANAAALDSKCIISSKNGATVTIENGTITAGGVTSDGMYGVAAFSGKIVLGKKGESNTGPSITSWFAAASSNNIGGSADITIYGGTYEAQAKPTTEPITSTWWHYFCAPVYIPSDGTVEISGGTFKGCYGVYSRYSGIEQTVSITGGDFTGVTEKTPIVNGNVTPTSPKQDVTKEVEVSGGTYKYELSKDLFKEGYMPQALEGGNYGVQTAKCTIEYYDGDTKLTDLTPTEHTYGTATTLPTYTKTGYNVDAGWYKTSDFSDTAITQLETSETGDDNWTLKLYAKKAPISYTITYDNTKDATNTNPTTYTIETEDITLADLAKDGYTFNSWLKDNASIETIKKGSTGNITLVADWSPNEYTIKYFDGDTQLTDLTPDKYTYGSKTTLPDVPEKAGYTKAGWYKDAAFTGDPIKEVSETDLDNLTLYAKYVAIPYAITYENTKDVQNDNPTTYTVEDEVTLKPLTKDGFTFAGWVDAEGNAVTSIPKGSTGEVILKATWKVQIKLATLTGTGTVKINGAEVKAEDIVEVDEGTEVTLSWLPAAQGERNLTLVKTIKVDGKDIDATSFIDKSQWQVANESYRKLMGDDEAMMSTYQKVSTVEQTIPIDIVEAAGQIVLDVEFGEYVPVYRLYNKITSEHLFTTNKKEYDDFVDLCEMGEDFWIGEGIDWFSEVIPETADTNTVRRLYNSALGAMGRSSHYYTKDEAEIENLKQNGWVDDGAANYIQSGGTVGIWTCYNEGLGSAHHYTSNKVEWEGLEQHQWQLEKDKNGDTGVFQAVLSAKP